MPGARLVDLNGRDIAEKDLDWADCAFISAMVVQWEAVRRIAARLKEAGIHTVADGSLINTEHERVELAL